MRKTVAIIILGVVISLFALLGLGAQSNELVKFNSLSADGIVLKWRVKGENLDLVVSAKTTGWVAVGFDPARRMKDANIIIGYVKDGKVFIRDDFGVATTFHKSDVSLKRKDNVLNLSGSESKGITTLEFSIPLDSGDKFDRKLEKGKTYKVLLAYGREDDFSAYHAYRTTAEITLKEVK